MLVEVNLDALVGPTHHFGGLGVGNIASHAHQFRSANPRAAAIEGLQKALLASEMGIPQFILFPPPRPDLQIFSKLGFQGSIEEQISEAYQRAPQTLSTAFSSAFMWAANAATVSPAADSADGCLHFTPANLISSWHRATEWHYRTDQLRSLFSQVQNCTIHEPLPAIVPLRDEGAANHMRMSDDSLLVGFNVFVYGDADNAVATQRFAARQTLAACQAIARRHQLDPRTTFFLRQHPEAIDAGVFHNDVISTSHKEIFVHHEKAFWETEEELLRLENEFLKRTGNRLIRRVISEDELPLEDAVRSYFFNSQIVSPTDMKGKENIIICPAQCTLVESARRVVASLIDDPTIPIVDAKFVKLDESMAGGGGPACLRLRVPVDPQTLSSMPVGLRLDDRLADQLLELFDRCYPESLVLSDFTNADFRAHIATAYQALHQLERVCKKAI